MQRILFNLWCWLVLSSVLAGGHAGAGTAVDTVAGTPIVAEMEIAYLLQYVSQSKCDFYRNGRWYSPKDAQLHLQNKYKLLSENHRINSVEDFIEKAATRSSLSGLAYKIKCSGGDPMLSNRWLLDELGRYRVSGASRLNRPLP